MALNEGAILTDEEINAFVNPFKPDIRQSIIQLQYVLNSGVIDHVIFTPIIDILLLFLIINPFEIVWYLENTKKYLQYKYKLNLVELALYNWLRFCQC